jgi:hypothetical protein
MRQRAILHAMEREEFGVAEVKQKKKKLRTFDLLIIKKYRKAEHREFPPTMYISRL